MHWQWSAARALVEVERPVRAAVAEHAIAEASTARARARRIVRADPRDVVDALAADEGKPFPDAWVIEDLSICFPGFTVVGIGVELAPDLTLTRIGRLHGGGGQCLRASCPSWKPWA